jgi:peptidoglycan-N-acetylglucosamine deacetylase
MRRTFLLFYCSLFFTPAVFLHSGTFPKIHAKFTLQDSSLVFFHGRRSQKNIALTFDACPAYGSHSLDRKVFQTLVDSQVPATIFVSGRWMRTHMKEMEELAAVPFFEFGNHSYSHHHMANMPADSIVLELQKVQHLLSTIYHKAAKVFRAPYGELSDGLVQSVRSSGLTTAQFDLASGDPDTSITKDRLIRYVVRSARNGSIIVMHINGRGWHTAEALPAIIEGLHKRGFRFATVGELLQNSEAAVKK